MPAWEELWGLGSAGRERGSDLNLQVQEEADHRNPHLAEEAKLQALLAAHAQNKRQINKQTILPPLLNKLQ